MDTCAHPNQWNCSFQKTVHTFQTCLFTIYFSFKMYLLNIKNVNPEQEIDLSPDLIAHDQKLIVELGQV